MLDLARQHGPLRGELDAAVARVLASGTFVGGPEVEAFEAEFAAWNGAARCVGVGNCTDALAVALRALGVGAGDEVVVPAAGFFATAEAVVLAGATPVFCDVDLATANLDPADLAARVTPRTRAVVAVHLYGRPADMAGVHAVAGRHGLAVVEDCAQAAGATWRGRKVGTIGDAGCFSFYPSKNLGALGDAGAILTSDPELARRCRRLANHGGERKYEHVAPGSANSRLDALQAAVLRAKLPHLGRWNAERAALAALYRERLAGLPVEVLAEGEAGHAHHLFVVRAARRDEVLAALRRAGVVADVHYPQALPSVPALAHLRPDPADHPRARAHAASCLSLPLFPGMREDEVDRVAAALAAAS